MIWQKRLSCSKTEEPERPKPQFNQNCSGGGWGAAAAVNSAGMSSNQQHKCEGVSLFTPESI